MKTPSEHEFPITFDHALRLAVGGRDVPERFRVFRAWWKSELGRIAKFTGVLRDNTDETIFYFRQNGVDCPWFTTFCKGIADYKIAKRKERMSNLAKTRWDKPKAEKRSRMGKRKSSSCKK